LQKVRDILGFRDADRDKLIILDEIQRLPEVFAPLRGIIDKGRRKGNKSGQFLFLGSASIDLLRNQLNRWRGGLPFWNFLVLIN